MPAEAARLAARKAALQRDLERMLALRGPVSEVRRLVADLDRVAEELARSMGNIAAPRGGDHHITN
jgi:hypothetical protein